MKKYFLQFILWLVFGSAYALSDSTVIPIQRQRNHERINEEQVKCDKADGKLDGMVKVSGNDEVNLQVTDALIRKINVHKSGVTNIDFSVDGNYIMSVDDTKRIKYTETLTGITVFLVFFFFFLFLFFIFLIVIINFLSFFLYFSLLFTHTHIY